MKKFVKPFKFYLSLFIFSSLLILGYSLYKIINDGTSVGELYTTWFLPIFFIGIYWGSDVLLEKVFNRKKKVDYEGKFLDAIGEKMRSDNAFLIEDYRRLQINMKFQAALKIAFKIHQDGEDEEFSLDKLKRKFKKDTVENKAMTYVIDYIKENKVNDSNQDENKV